MARQEISSGRFCTIAEASSHPHIAARLSNVGSCTTHFRWGRATVKETTVRIEQEDQKMGVKTVMQFARLDAMGLLSLTRPPPKVAKKGLATLCIGGGMGIAMCVERT